MALMNSAEGWGLLSRLFHWSMALVVLFAFGLGFYMVNVVGDDLIQRFELTQTHKSWGFVVFALVLLRMGWRLVNPTPAMPQGMTRIERAAASGAHVVLYGLMIAIPVTGWLMASASPLNDPDAYPVQVKNMVFGLFELPDPIAPGDKALAETLASVHEILGWVLVALVLIHVGAALKHQFVARDGTLRRMITGRP